KLHFAAEKDGDRKSVAHHKQNPIPLDVDNPTPEAAVKRRPVDVVDVFSNKNYKPLIPATDPKTPPPQTVLAVPLMARNELFGVISIWRRERRDFSRSEIAMVNTFAAQAVIAIQNARLFNETKAALERQTATADVLAVISSSPTDITPVLHAVAERAARLCEATDVVIRRVEG